MYSDGFVKKSKCTRTGGGVGERGAKKKHVRLVCGLQKENWTAPNIFKDDSRMKYLLEGGVFLVSTTLFLGVMGGWEGAGLVGRDGR